MIGEKESCGEPARSGVYHLMLLMFGLVGIAAATYAGSGIGFLLLVGVALFTSAAVMIKRVLNRKP